MAKTKISEFSATSADNTDITNINIAEGCSPANVNNAIRSLMSLLKNQQDGSSGDPFSVAGTFAITGGFTLDGTAGACGQVLLSAGSGNTPTWGNAFVAGMIMLWSGSIQQVFLVDGCYVMAQAATPDLRNRFVVGALRYYWCAIHSTVLTQTGGSADAIVVSHTHTATSTVTDPGHNHTYPLGQGYYNTQYTIPTSTSADRQGLTPSVSSSTTGITVATTNSTTGSSGTNANLPPYYALCYIMKS
jgi:hypothetical protein